MKKRAALLVLSAMLLFSFGTGVFAASKITAIKAYLNSGTVIQVNGKKFLPKNEKNQVMYPIVYNGKTYVPVTAFAQALGAKVAFKGTGDGTYTITTGSSSSNAGKPSNDGPATPSTPSSPATKATGSLTSPIPMNEKYTFSSTYKYKETSYSGTYSCTIKSAKPISRDEIAALGFKKPDSEDKIDYLMVEMQWEVKNAKVISLPKDTSNMYLSQWGPDIWGSETASGRSIIGGTDYGFDESLSTKIRNAVDYKKLEVGSAPASFSVQGKFILPIMKNEVNYFVLKNEAEQDYDKSKIHFKLK